MTPLELARRALALAGPHSEVVVHRERWGMARFAASEVHQPTLIDDTTVQVHVVRPDGCGGVATTNRLDDASLGAAARRAQEAAAAAPPDADAAALAGPAEQPAIPAPDQETADLGADGLARAATAAIDAATLPVYGFFTSGETALAIASATGLEAEQRSTDATLSVLAATEDASGWASRTSRRAVDIDLAGCAREAVEKAERTRGGVPVEPGRYRAVLEPYAVAELLQYFAFDCFSGLALEEERSFYAGRLGQQVFAPSVSIVDDALDPRGLPAAFDYEGTPKRRVELASAGVAAGVVWDRASAARAGAVSTGHALPAHQRAWGPMALALAMDGGDAHSVDDLCEAVGEGVYVTRVHYVNIVASREGVLTGTTRDGTFRIRGGRVVEPLVNHRFSLSMPDLLRDVLALTRERRLVNASDFYEERQPCATLVPALATASFTLTGAGSSPGL